MKTQEELPCENCNGYGDGMIGDPDIGQEERSQVCATCEGSGVAKVLLLEWPDDVTRLSGDGGESLSEWDRNRIQDERDREEAEWYANERNKAATADGFKEDFE